MTEYRYENVYSNIDPVTGSVAGGGERIMLQTRGDYAKMASSGYLPRGVGSGEWRPPGGLRKRFQHLAAWGFLLKLAEIALLLTCGCLYAETIHRICNTMSTMMIPYVFYVSFFIITLCVTVSLAAKRKFPDVFCVIFHSLAALLLSVSGGVVISVWLSVPRKLQTVYSGEYFMILVQSALSFAAAVLYLADLALSLNSLNGLDKR